MSDHYTQSTAPAPLLKAQKWANLLDSSIKLPFVRFEIGIDAIVGLIPVVGDMIMLLASLRIVQLGKQLGLPAGLLRVMLRNVGVDFLLGLIPFVGDIIDFFYKANQANVRIMEMYWVSNNKDNIDKNTQELLTRWEQGLD